MVDGGGYVFASGGWLWMVVVGCGRYILLAVGDGGWWWMVVGHGGWWHSLA